MSRYRKVLYLTGVRIDEWEWDAKRQNETYRIEYDDDVSKEVMSVLRAARVRQRASRGFTDRTKPEGH